MEEYDLVYVGPAGCYYPGLGASQDLLTTDKEEAEKRLKSGGWVIRNKPSTTKDAKKDATETASQETVSDKTEEKSVEVEPELSNHKPKKTAKGTD